MACCRKGFWSDAVGTAVRQFLGQQAAPALHRNGQHEGWGRGRQTKWLFHFQHAWVEAANPAYEVLSAEQSGLIDDLKNLMHKQKNLVDDRKSLAHDRKNLIDGLKNLIDEQKNLMHDLKNLARKQNHLAHGVKTVMHDPNLLVAEV